MADLAPLLGVGEHDDGATVLLPHHAPEVWNRVASGALRGNVGLGLHETLGGGRRGGRGGEGGEEGRRGGEGGGTHMGHFTTLVVCCECYTPSVLYNVSVLLIWQLTHYICKFFRFRPKTMDYSPWFHFWELKISFEKSMAL